MLRVYKTNENLSQKMAQPRNKICNVFRWRNSNGQIISDLFQTESSHEKRHEGSRNINTKIMKFFVPIQKIEDLLSLLLELSKSDVASARQVSKIAGRVISMQLAIGPLARLFTGQMCFFVETSSTWDDKEVINNCLNQEIHF